MRKTGIVLSLVSLLAIVVELIFVGFFLAEQMELDSELGVIFIVSSASEIFEFLLVLLFLGLFLWTFGLLSIKGRVRRVELVLYFVLVLLFLLSASLHWVFLP